MEVTRSATLSRGPSGPDGIIGKYVSDTGYSCLIQERQDLNNAPDVSCVLKDRYLVTWFPSPKHGWCYKLEDKHGRTVVEIHSANVFEQLEGCLAPGILKAKFDKDSLHPPKDGKPGVPSRDMVGVTSSGPALKALEKDMQDSNGKQMPFYLKIC